VIGVATAWAMAKAGVGAALLPLQFVNSQELDSDLLLYTVKSSPYTRQPAVVTRKDQVMTPYAEYAIQVLTNEL
jgi:DNA-binding transcriptional LysR family regulator